MLFEGNGILGMEAVKDRGLGSFKCIRTCRVGSFAVLRTHASEPVVFQRQCGQKGSWSVLDAMGTGMTKGEGEREMQCARTTAGISSATYFLLGL